MLEKNKNIEIELLTDAIYKVYGYDFRHYNKTSLFNRFESITSDSGLNYLSDFNCISLSEGSK